MTYKTVADMQEDYELRRRLVAACAVEKADEANPSGWVSDRIWDLVTQPGWADAYGYAKNAGNAHPGADEAVVTDGMILSALQAIEAAEAPAPPTPAQQQAQVEAAEVATPPDPGVVTDKGPDVAQPGENLQPDVLLGDGHPSEHGRSGQE